MKLPLFSTLQAQFLLYCNRLTIPNPPWQMGFCMWIVLPGGMRRNPKGRNFGAKSIGHATSRGTANELKCLNLVHKFFQKVAWILQNNKKIRVYQDQSFTVFVFISMSHWSVSKSYWKRTVLLTGFHLCTSMDLFMSMSQVFKVIKHKNSEFKQRTQMKTHVNIAATNLVSWKHWRAHTGRKPFPCEQCHNKFSELKALKST